MNLKKRLIEDIEIEKEKEIARFEEEIFLEDLREKLRFNKEEKIITLYEESRE